MRAQSDFTQGKILAPLMRFTLPILAALVLQALYGAVDLLVVGQFAADKASGVSAVSTGSQLMHAVTAIITGLSMGVTVLIGQAIGRRDERDAGDSIGGGIVLFLLVGALLTAILVFLAHPLALLMNAPQKALSQTVDYIRICGAGTLFIVAYNVLGSVFRGMGDARTPLVAVLIACVANIGLDILFVAGLGMAAAGAALATVISQAASVALSLLVIRRRALPFPFSRAQVRASRRVFLGIARLGGPCALQDFLVSVSFLVLLTIVNGLGLTFSAGMGVAEKLCMFIMLVPSAYMQAISAFVAQNIGAGKPRRARRAMVTGMLTSLAVSVFVAYLSYFHGDHLAAIFTSAQETQVIAAAWDYLRAYAIDTLLVSFLFCFIGYFNGCGRTTFVMLQGLAGAFGVRIPVSWLVSRAQNVSLFEIGLATPCSTLVQILVCALFFAFLVRRERREAQIRPADVTL